MEEKTVVLCYGKPITKREISIADASKQLPMTLWAQFTDAVEDNKTYDFNNVSTRIYNGQLRLTTTLKSTIEPAEELLCVTKGTENEDQQILTKLEFLSANIVTKCGSCFKPIPGETIGAEETQCPNCNMYMLNSSLKPSTTLKINIDQSRLTAFNGTLRPFLESQGKLHLLSSSRDLCRYVLHLPQIKLVYDNNIIKSISLPSVPKPWTDDIPLSP